MHRSIDDRHRVSIAPAARGGAARRAALAVLAAGVLAVVAACGGGEREARHSAEQALTEAKESLQQKASDGMVHVDPLSFSAAGVTIDRKGGGASALVTADGALQIDGQDVALTPAQRALFVQYHDAARQLRTHAIETGLAGVDVAKVAVGEVLGGLLKGDTSQIERKVEASAAGVKAAAFKLCGDLETLGGIEQSLSGLEAFAPYRFVDTAKIDDCRKETATAAAEPATPAAPAAPTAPAAAPASAATT